MSALLEYGKKRCKSVSESDDSSSESDDSSSESDDSPRKEEVTLGRASPRKEEVTLGRASLRGRSLSGQGFPKRKESLWAGLLLRGREVTLPSVPASLPCLCTPPSYPAYVHHPGYTTVHHAARGGGVARVREAWEAAVKRTLSESTLTGTSLSAMTFRHLCHLLTLSSGITSFLGV